MFRQIPHPPRLLLVPLVPHPEPFQPRMRPVHVLLGLFLADDVLGDDEPVLQELFDQGRIRVEFRGRGVGFDDPGAVGGLDGVGLERVRGGGLGCEHC